MTDLTLEEVKHIAQLAKLQLKAEQLEKFKKQLSQVVEYISQLSEVETQEVEPTSQTTGLINVERSDRVDLSNTLSQEEALSGSQSTHNGYFLVPGVLENKNEE